MHTVNSSVFVLCVLCARHRKIHKFFAREKVSNRGKKTGYLSTTMVAALVIYVNVTNKDWLLNSFPAACDFAPVVSATYSYWLQTRNSRSSTIFSPSFSCYQMASFIYNRFHVLVLNFTERHAVWMRDCFRSLVVSGFVKYNFALKCEGVSIHA